MYGPRHGRLVARRQAAGKIVAGACTSGAETDQKTIDCLVKAALKALDFVEDPELDSPECLAPELPFAPHQGGRPARRLPSPALLRLAERGVRGVFGCPVTRPHVRRVRLDLVVRRWY